MEITSRAHEWVNSLLSRYPNSGIIHDNVSAIRSAQKFYIGRADEFVLATKAPVTADDISRLPYKRMIVEASVTGSDLSWVVIFVAEINETELRLIFAQKSTNGEWVSTAPFTVEIYGETVRTIGHIERSQIEQYKWAFALLMRTCLAMRCENVRAVVPKSYRPTTTRPKGGKQPLFSHKVLVVDTANDEAESDQPFTGTHASPRLHLRRGHIRRLANGKTVWIQPCVVGDKSKGMITKDYFVKA